MPILIYQFWPKNCKKFEPTNFWPPKFKKGSCQRTPEWTNWKKSNSETLKLAKSSTKQTCAFWPSEGAKNAKFGPKCPKKARYPPQNGNFPLDPPLLVSSNERTFSLPNSKKVRTNELLPMHMGEKFLQMNCKVDELATHELQEKG